MASSESEICSAALVLVGGKPITALTDNTREARLCARLYPKTLQEVLRMAPWACAQKEAVLNQDAIAAPLYTFKYSYQLPPDYIRVWNTNLDKVWGGSGWQWQIMGKKLVTDATAVSINYVHRVTDVLLFDTLLEKALIYDLAEKLAYPISQKFDVQQGFDNMRQRACNQAMAINTQEQTKKRFMSTSLTTDVR